MTGRPRLDVRQLLASQMTEAELDQCVRDLAKLLNLHVFSVRQSKAGVVTSPGWPDLVICGPGGVLFRELKRQDGKIRPDQQRWGAALQAARQDWAIWRPGDWIDKTIDAELRIIATATGRTSP